MARRSRRSRRRWYLAKTLDGLARLYGVNETAARTAVPDIAERLIAASRQGGGRPARSTGSQRDR